MPILTPEEAQRRFLNAWRRGQLPELLRDIGAANVRKSFSLKPRPFHGPPQGNLNAVKDGAYSKRIMQVLLRGSPAQLGEVLQIVRRRRDARQQRRARMQCR